MVFCSLEPGHWRCLGQSLLRLITLVGYLLLPFTYTLFTLFYALYGSILYVVGPFVLALMPSRGLGQLGRSFFVNMMIFQCGACCTRFCKRSCQRCRSQTRCSSRGSFLNAFVGFQPSDRDERGKRAAVDHDRPDSLYRQPHRARRCWQHTHDGNQRSRHGRSRGIRIGICRRRRFVRRKNACPGRTATSTDRRAWRRQPERRFWQSRLCCWASTEHRQWQVPRSASLGRQRLLTPR